MRLASAIETGRFDPALNALEVQWADPATRTLAQDADAVLKLVAAGVLPPDAGLELIGFSATQVARINAMRQAAPAPDPTTTEGAA